MVPGGGPYILIGRTRDYAWSLTSATNDNRDEFLEKLCDPDGSAPTRASTHYVYKGRCRAMTRFDAGLLGASGSEPARELTFDMTVHGPVVGTATIGGRPYAIARKRSTYGQDGVSLGALHDMTLGRATTPRRFWRIADEFGFTFNWAYVSRRHVAYFSSGLLPRRAPGLNRLLPTVGSGAYDWRGWLPALAHPHDVDPRGGLFLNWNNKPAHGWIGGDDDHAWGSVHRVEMFDRFPRRVRLRDVVSIMNRAATEDLRATRVWPVVRAVLGRSAAPNPMTARAVALLDSWSRRGASRLDRDLDGKVDDQGAAIVDAAFPRIAKAVVGGQLGALTDQLATLQTIDGEPNPGGSSFGGGWYGYVDKDLRALLGRPLRSRFNLRYCGRGSLSACRSALWSALADATQELSAAKGPNPSAWRADATAERIRFQPGLISDTMRWTNRPTFQQVLRFAHPPARRHPRLTG